MIKLKEFDENNIEDLKFTKVLQEDKLISDNVYIVQSPKSNALNEVFYIIKNDDTSIGMLSINCPFMGTKTIANINVGILEEYRNKGYSKDFLEEIYNMMLTEEKYSLVKDILVITSYKNKSALASVLKAGFSQNQYYQEKAYEEGAFSSCYFLSKEVQREKTKIK